ncbi:MAG TPA: hypothetical protein VH575_18505 [Gemmataceae bacterium]|jgi:hypothetical protein
MSNRAWLCLLLGASLTIVPSRIATAQFKQPGLAQFKQSHHPLPDEKELRDDPALMADRLRELHELHQLQDQVRELFKNQDFVNEIKHQFTDEQLRRLQEKILQGGGPGGESDWNKRLQEAAKQSKLNEQQLDILRRLNGQQFDILRRFIEEGRVTSPFDPPSMNSRPPSFPPVLPSSVPDPKSMSFPPPSPQRSFWDRMQDASEKWLSEHMEDLSDDMVHALTEMGADNAGTPLAELLRAIKQADLPTGGLVEPAAAELSRHLPNVGEFLNEQHGNWNEMFSLFREVPGSSLPALGGGPSMPALSSTAPASGGGSGASLTLLTFGVFVLLLWKMGGWSWLRKDRGEAGAWQLGAWPVAPDAVATRQDLVRAFEHLALLCLGRSASPCHHRELAGRLIEQDAGDPTRRQAVELLAWLYEQARYAPAEESLSQAELSDARHALRYLAGVTTV